MQNVHFDVSKEFWANIKYQAARRGLTIPQLIIEALEQYFKPDEKEE